MTVYRVRSYRPAEQRFREVKGMLPILCVRRYRVRWHKGMKLNSVHELSKSTSLPQSVVLVLVATTLDWLGVPPKCATPCPSKSHQPPSTVNITIFKRQCYGQVQTKGKMFILNHMCVYIYICILCYYVIIIIIYIFIHSCQASLLYATPPKNRNPWVWHFLESCKIHKSTWEKFLECEVLLRTGRLFSQKDFVLKHIDIMNPESCGNRAWCWETRWNSLKKELDQDSWWCSEYVSSFASWPFLGAGFQGKAFLTHNWNLSIYKTHINTHLEPKWPVFWKVSPMK